MSYNHPEREGSTAPMTKLSRETLADRAARELVAFVRAEGLGPGDPLPPETRLAARFGVSRPVIREALQILRGRGLLDANHHRTATIAASAGAPLAGFVEHALLFDPHGPLRMLEFRRGVEVEAARLAAVRADPEERRVFRATVERMAAALHDLDAYVEADIELHDRIAAASGNRIIADFLASVRRASRETIEIGLRSRMSDAELERVQGAHEQLVDALEAGDPDAAGTAMAYQFDDAVRAIGRQLGDGDRPPSAPRTAGTHGGVGR